MGNLYLSFFSNYVYNVQIYVILLYVLLLLLLSLSSLLYTYTHYIHIHIFPSPVPQFPGKKKSLHVCESQAMASNTHIHTLSLVNSNLHKVKRFRRIWDGGGETKRIRRLYLI